MTFSQLSPRVKKMFKVLIDADLILELFLNRSEFIESAERLFYIQSQYRDIQMYITDQCLVKIHMHLNIPDHQVGNDAVLSIQKMFNQHIITVTFDHIEKARLSSINDFESSVEIACAIELTCDAIVTNQVGNFVTSALSVWSTDELELRLKLEQVMKPILSDELSTYMIQVTHRISMETAEFLLLKANELQEQLDKTFDDFMESMETKLIVNESMKNSKLREIRIAQINRDIDGFMALQQKLIDKYRQTGS